MAEAPATKAPAPKKSGSKARRSVPLANVYVSASYNNTLMTVTDQAGKVLSWASAGATGFKGSRKATPYAATVTAEKLVEKMAPYGVQKIRIFVTGVGTGREQAVRGLQAAGLDIEAIYDTTPIPHNGCRKRKARRI